MENLQLEQVLQKTLQRFRLLGWVFFVVGGCMFLFFLFTLLDPEASIRVNGVETRDFGEKLGAAAFLGIFTVIGALLALLPQKRIEPIFRHTLNRVAEMQAKIGMKK